LFSYVKCLNKNHRYRWIPNHTWDCSIAGYCLLYAPALIMYNLIFLPP